MKKLVIVTVVWAFSFSLISEFLAGKVDSYFAAFLRCFIALLCFLPFMIKYFNRKYCLHYVKATIIGALQIGLMYIFYYRSFYYLTAVEVALFTPFTPFYVSIFYDFVARRFRILYLLSITVAVFGALIVKYGNVNSSFWIGFLLVQCANICFGIGQSYYKYVFEDCDYKHQKYLFGYFFVGASLITGISFLLLGDFSKTTLDLKQFFVVLHLSIVASAIGYFLWNKGSCEVDSGVLAIMNNAVIPCAIIVNLLFWNKNTDLFRLIFGGFIMYLSLLLHKRIIHFYENRIKT